MVVKRKCLMNKKQFMVTWKVGCLLVLIFVFQPLSLLAEEQLPVNDILLEANESFTYNGIPIHPGLIKEFTSWISDPGLPTTISVDVAAPHGN